MAVGYCASGRRSTHALTQAGHWHAFSPRAPRAGCAAGSTAGALGCAFRRNVFPHLHRVRRPPTPGAFNGWLPVCSAGDDGSTGLSASLFCSSATPAGAVPRHDNAANFSAVLFTRCCLHAGDGDLARGDSHYPSLQNRIRSRSLMPVLQYHFVGFSISTSTSSRTTASPGFMRWRRSRRATDSFRQVGNENITRYIYLSFI